MKNDFNKVLKAIKLVMEQENINVPALEKMTDKKQQNIHRFLKGNQKPNWNTLESIFNSLEIEIKLFRNGKELT